MRTLTHFRQYRPNNKVSTIHCILLYILVEITVAGAGADNSATFNLNSVPLQPCDRSRRVFTDLRGEISDGPTNSNYTQVSN